MVKKFWWTICHKGMEYWHCDMVLEMKWYRVILKSIMSDIRPFLIKSRMFQANWDNDMYVLIKWLALSGQKNDDHVWHSTLNQIYTFYDSSDFWLSQFVISYFIKSWQHCPEPEVKAIRLCALLYQLPELPSTDVEFSESETEPFSVGCTLETGDASFTFGFSSTEGVVILTLSAPAQTIISQYATKVSVHHILQNDGLGQDCGNSSALVIDWP